MASARHDSSRADALLLALALSTAAKNQNPSTPDWELAAPALPGEIDGYVSGCRDCRQSLRWRARVGTYG
jgi:hypothetical protein